MDKYKILYEDDNHKCIMFSFDDEEVKDAFLSVNQYLIIDNDVAILIDPGSEAIFDELVEAIEEFISIEKIKYIFFSHQDPDVSGSITQFALVTNAKFILSSLWVRFMSHYGFTQMNRILQLPDKGAKITLHKNIIKFVPAHFLHSPGNFSVYDEKSKIVFSGDIGAAVLNSIHGAKRVEDFETHKEFLYNFHKRYMASNKVCQAWVKKIRKLDVKMIAPQHGFVFEDNSVEEFLDWLNELQCGSDLIEEIY